jgi:hypothetical protein
VSRIVPTLRAVIFFMGVLLPVSVVMPPITVAIGGPE